MQHGTFGERGHAVSQAGANVIHAARVLERLEDPGFVYRFRLLSPNDCDRDRLIRLRTRLEAPVSGHEFHDLHDELRAIPLHEVWADEVHNLVPTVGKNHLLDNWLAGSAYTAAWYMGLTSTGATYAAGDTMGSHSGWTESTAYSQANRITCAFSAASASAKALSSALAFSINASATIAGAFIATVNTKGGTTGTLGSASNFTGGDRAVSNGDTLSVSGSWSV